jgi:hypothetical protein
VPAVVLAATIAAAIVASLIGAAVGDGADPDGHVARASAEPLPPAAAPVGTVAVSVRVDLRHQGQVVAPGYLGLSFEAADLPRIASYGGRGDMTALLRSLGPGLLRFGGVSADTRIAWSDAAMPLPAWAAEGLQASDLRSLRALAERSGWRVLLTVGLAHYEPRRAAREVAAAKRLLGPWLAGIEVGNEPDAYERHAFRSSPWGFARYRAQVSAYRRAIARVALGVPLAGPGVSGSHVFARWGPREAARLHPMMLTGHHYPLGCRQQPPPSIERLLSAHTRLQEARSLGRYMAVSRASGIPFRMDEANSVSCGGRAGISNAFASALWATGYIAQALGEGVSGINFQGNPANCLGYTPVCATSAARLAAGALTAQPLWYAMTLSRGLAGDRPVAAATSAPPGANLLVRAFRGPAGALQFVIVDDEPPGAAAAGITLHVGRGYRTAAVVPLTAPSPESTSGVRLASAAIASDGSLASAARIARPPALAGVVNVTVAPSSAALVTVGG